MARATHYISGSMTVFVLLCVLLLGAQPGYAATKVRDVTAQVVADGVTVSARLVGNLPAKAVAQINNGVPKELFYTVALVRRHRRFFDEQLLARTVRFHIKYDTLEDRYHLTRTEQDGEIDLESGADVDDTAASEPVTTYASTWQEALQFLSTVEDVMLPRPDGVARFSHYVRVKAEMRAAKLPLYLDYVLFFIPISEFKTPWSRTPVLPVRPATE